MSTPDREDQYLDLYGILHEVNLAPAGTEDDPWPFLMATRDGHGSTAVLIHREDAQQLIEFLTRHLAEAPTLGAT